ncbi:hypothetical protein VV089_21670 [Candidatus Merdisoma sp. JLR.KK011]|uniref:PP2C family protein-serine/threonine phosphatase n=1 Tax=Candidatus Merdisoma sp. JLR.KK011 TaxID=3114299 RepID=UPI002FF0C756
MRKQNSEFKTAFTSEAGRDLKNTDYFGFVELDDFACYVMADGIDDQTDAVSARLAVAAAVSAFSEAPSMKKRTMQACLAAANRALLEAKSKNKLKASILIVLTNYVKFRYGQAGNIRLRLCRDGFTRLRSLDQSLTADLVREEKVEPDKVAVHEERNNLFAYLGKEKEFYPFVSKKFKLLSGDVIALYTRGIWENIDEGELKDAFEEASEEPRELVDNVEDLLLSRQPEALGKYTFAALFINKVFTDPNKKRRIRRIIMITIPILLMLAVLTTILVIRYRKREEKRVQMELGYTDTIEYVQADNYVRALERCQEASELAKELKNARMQKELGNYQKLIEAVLSAQEQLEAEKYGEAQKLYQEASNRSAYVDHAGLDYINDRLALTASYITVYDLISLGDTLAQNLQYDKAEEKYLEAKAIAGKIYFDAGRTMAMEALEKLYEDQKAEKEAEEEERKALLAQQESGANYTAQGDAAFAQGDYESAKVYYTSARQVYQEMVDDIQCRAAEEKLASAEKKISEQDTKKQEAEDFVKQAEAASDAQDFVTAKTCYLVAKDIYASLKMEDEVEGLTRKMEVLDIKAGLAE